MLHHILGNPRPWHGHYYCALALVPALVIQMLLSVVVRGEWTAGASIASIAVFSYLVRVHYSFSVIANVVFLFLWGLRVCVRGVPEANNSFVETTVCEAALARTAWTWVLSAPTAFGVAFDTRELPRGYPAVGVALCASALLTDLLEQNVMQGKLSRNPYVFSSLTMSWGLYVIHPSAWTIPFPILFTWILIDAPGGLRWNENIRKIKAKIDPRLAEYVRTTSPLIPLLPGMYVRLTASCTRCTTPEKDIVTTPTVF